MSSGMSSSTSRAPIPSKKASWWAASSVVSTSSTSARFTAAFASASCASVTGLFRRVARRSWTRASRVPCGDFASMEPLIMNRKGSWVVGSQVAISAVAPDSRDPLAAAVPDQPLCRGLRPGVPDRICWRTRKAGKSELEAAGAGKASWKYCRSTGPCSLSRRSPPCAGSAVRCGFATVLAGTPANVFATRAFAAGVAKSPTTASTALPGA